MKNYSMLTLLWLLDTVDDKILRHKLYPTLCEFTAFGIQHYQNKLGPRRTHLFFHSFISNDKYNKCVECGLIQTHDS